MQRRFRSALRVYSSALIGLMSTRMRGTARFHALKTRSINIGNRGTRFGVFKPRTHCAVNRRKCWTKGLGASLSRGLVVFEDSFRGGDAGVADFTGYPGE